MVQKCSFFLQLAPQDNHGQPRAGGRSRSHTYYIYFSFSLGVELTKLPPRDSRHAEERVGEWQIQRLILLGLVGATCSKGMHPRVVHGGDRERKRKYSTFPLSKWRLLPLPHPAKRTFSMRDTLQARPPAAGAAVRARTSRCTHLSAGHGGGAAAPPSEWTARAAAPRRARCHQRAGRSRPGCRVCTELPVWRPIKAY